MVRGEKAGGKRNLRKRVKFGERGSDDSDEDYVISEEETDVSEDVLEDLDGSALDEEEVDYEEEVEEEEEEVEEKSSHGKKASNKSLLRNGAVFTTYDEDVVEDEEVENEEEETLSKSGSRPRSSCGKTSEVGVENEEDDEDGKKEEEENASAPQSRPWSSCGKKSDRISLQKNRAVPSNEEDDEEYIVNDDDVEEDDDQIGDAEFTPEGEGEIDCLEDEEDLAEKKRTGSEITTYRSTSTSRASQSCRRRNKRSKISRKALKKIGTEWVVVRRKSRSYNDDSGDDTGDFLKDSTRWRSRINNTRRRKRRYVASSDSDFVTSGSSDCEYTISEEEREQLREGNDLCGSLAPCTSKSSTSKRSVTRRNLSVRSLSSCNRTGEGDNLANQSKPTGAEGKEKMEESNVVKQVCGICLSEADKRNVRGTLDCCSHFFCFTCIREWSKVESRCPLCKQRFHTITKSARCTAGLDLRDDVIHVPERDQVYQPTDEEIRGYLDPYEIVICTECLQGGDDDLMLLCDICDSPAHTFCVGLGREVPEGSWYCYGCRPSALASLSSLSHDNQRMSSNLSSWTMPATEGFDLNEPSSIQVLNLQSPRYPPGISQSLVPLSGAQAFALSDRRMIHRRIQLRNGRSSVGGRTDGPSTSIFRIEPLPYPVDQGRLATLQPMGMEAREPNVSSLGGLQMENSFPSSQRREIPVFAAPSTSGLLFPHGYDGVNLISMPDQSQQSSF